MIPDIAVAVVSEPAMISVVAVSWSSSTEIPLGWLRFFSTDVMLFCSYVS